MRGRTVIIAIACSVGLVLAGCSTQVAGSAQLPANVGDHVSSSDPGTEADPGSDSGMASGSDADRASAVAPVTPTIPTDPGDLESILGDDGESIPTDLGDLESLLGESGGAIPTDMGDLGSLLGESGGAMPTDLGELGSSLGMAGPCLNLASVSISAGLILLSPSIGGTPLSQADVDKAFADAKDLPPQAQSAIDTLHQLAEKAVGQPADTVRAILDSDAYTSATDELSRAMETACGG